MVDLLCVVRIVFTGVRLILPKYVDSSESLPVTQIRCLLFFGVKLFIQSGKNFM